jgi:hypothetical protein
VRLRELIAEALDAAYTVDDFAHVAYELERSRAEITDPIAWIIPKLGDMWAARHNGAAPPALVAPRRTTGSQVSTERVSLARRNEPPP